MYHVECVVHGLSSCDACFWGFSEKDIALAKSTFDSQMSQIEDGSGIVVVVRICVMMELAGALVCGHDGLTESRFL
jgi:hypothetical protein